MTNSTNPLLAPPLPQRFTQSHTPMLPSSANVGTYFGHYLHQAAIAIRAWLSNQLSRWWSPSLSQMELAQQQTYVYKMDTLEKSLALPFKTYHELVQRVRLFFDELLPFQHYQLTEVSADVFDLIKAMHGYKAAAYVAANVGIDEFQMQLVQEVSEGRSYLDILQIMAGTQEVTPEKDLNQLKIALKEHNKIPSKERNFSLQIDESSLQRLIMLAKKQCQTSKECFDPTLEERLQLLSTIYPPRLVKALGGLEKFLSLPVLHTTNFHTGITGYIDNIAPREMRYPVMRGIDAFGRPFVAFCYRVYEEEVVEVAFQRYTDMKWNWVTGICCGHHSAMIQRRERLYGIDEEPNPDERTTYSDDVAYMGKLMTEGVKRRKKVVVKKDDGYEQHQIIEDPNGESFDLCRRY